MLGRVERASKPPTLVMPPLPTVRMRPRTSVVDGLAASCSSQLTRNLKPSPSTAEKPSVERSEGRLVARAMPIAELAVFLRWHSPRPILDETGLDGRYDFVVEWDPKGGPRELFLALGDLGLQIVRGRDDYPFLFVKRTATATDG